ncbi:MAG: orotate phosphoribosyltransferase [Opitutae bacterium]|jgi:orotate phosphoribosyltransferase|nr:orotate phosphoribosyltransferase [Opitutae bacterium]
MSKTEQEIIQIFKDSGALLEGHFVLRSGLHSGHFFQCAQVCQYLDKVTRLVEILVEQLKDYEVTTVVGNAMGGLVIGQEVARQLNKRYIFLEKVNDALKLRRNFKFSPDEKVLIIEDVITKGGRVYEAIDEIKSHGGNPVAVGVIVDRSSGKTHFEIPHHSLAELNFPTYEADKLPEELKNIPTSKPGS